jgi:hypothetical protein
MAITLSPNSGFVHGTASRPSVATSGSWLDAPRNMLLRLVAAQVESRRRSAMRELNRHRPFMTDTSLILNDVTHDLPFRG